MRHTDSCRLIVRSHVTSVARLNVHGFAFHFRKCLGFFSCLYLPPVLEAFSLFGTDATLSAWLPSSGSAPRKGPCRVVSGCLFCFDCLLLPRHPHPCPCDGPFLNFQTRHSFVSCVCPPDSQPHGRLHANASGNPKLVIFKTELVIFL